MLDGDDGDYHDQGRNDENLTPNVKTEPAVMA